MIALQNWPKWLDITRSSKGIDTTVKMVQQNLWHMTYLCHLGVLSYHLTLAVISFVFMQGYTVKANCMTKCYEHLVALTHPQIGIWHYVFIKWAVTLCVCMYSGTAPLACLVTMLHSQVRGDRVKNSIFFKLPGRMSLFTLKVLKHDPLPSQHFTNLPVRVIYVSLCYYHNWCQKKIAPKSCTWN